MREEEEGEGERGGVRRGRGRGEGLGLRLALYSTILCIIEHSGTGDCNGCVVE